MMQQAHAGYADFYRLRVACGGTLWILLAFIISGFVGQFMFLELSLVEAAIGLLYCACPAIGLIGLWRSPVIPGRGATYEHFVKAVRCGRFACLLLGGGCLVLGCGAPALLPAPWVFSLWLLVFGCLLLGWSFRFPSLPAGSWSSLVATKCRFSVKSLLVLTLVAAVYSAAVVWVSDPELPLAGRLVQPITALVVLGGACWFVISMLALVWIPVRGLWLVIAALRRRYTERSGSSSG